MRETILLLALASATAGVALRVVEPMLPRLAEDFAVGVSSAASVITAYAIGYAIGQLAYGPLGDRYGKLRVVTLTMFAASLASVACALAPDLGALAGARMLAALAAAATVTLGMAYIGDHVAPAERQTVVARFMSGTIIGQALGPTLGGFVTDTLGWRGAFAALGVVFIAIAVTLFARGRAQWASDPGAPFHGNPWTLHPRLMRIATVRIVVLSSSADAFLFFGAYSFLGAWLKLRFDLSLTVIGLLLAGFGVGGVLYTLSVGPLLRRLGQRGLVAWGGALCCACFTAIALTPLWWVAAPCTIGLGFSYYMLHNTLQTQATEMAPKARGAALSVFSSLWSLGQGIGVAAMGVAVQLAGFAPSLIAFGIGFLALGLWLRANIARLSPGSAV